MGLIKCNHSGCTKFIHVKLVAHKVVQITNCFEGMYECLGCWETFCLEHTNGHVCKAPPPPPARSAGGGGGGGCAHL